MPREYVSHLLPELSYRIAKHSAAALRWIRRSRPSDEEVIIRFVSTCGQAAFAGKNWKSFKRKSFYVRSRPTVAMLRGWYAMNLLLEQHVPLPLEKSCLSPTAYASARKSLFASSRGSQRGTAWRYASDCSLTGQLHKLMLTA